MVTHPLLKQIIFFIFKNHKKQVNSRHRDNPYEKKARRIERWYDVQFKQ